MHREEHIDDKTKTYLIYNLTLNLDVFTFFPRSIKQVTLDVLLYLLIVTPPNEFLN